MKTKRLYLLLIIGCFSLNVYSQQDTAEAAKEVDTIRIHQEAYFFKGKKMSSTKLEPLLTQFNLSEIEYQKYKRKAVPAGFIVLAGVTSGIIALVNLKKQTHFWTPWSISEFGLLAIGIPVIISANKHLKRSVRHYNIKVLQ